jgi:hypothetical protein
VDVTAEDSAVLIPEAPAAALAALVVAIQAEAALRATGSRIILARFVNRMAS